MVSTHFLNKRKTRLFRSVRLSALSQSLRGSLSKRKKGAPVLTWKSEVCTLEMEDGEEVTVTAGVQGKDHLFDRVEHSSL